MFTSLQLFLLPAAAIVSRRILYILVQAELCSDQRRREVHKCSLSSCLQPQLPNVILVHLRRSGKVRFPANTLRNNLTAGLRQQFYHLHIEAWHRVGSCLRLAGKLAQQAPCASAGYTDMYYRDSQELQEPPIEVPNSEVPWESVVLFPCSTVSLLLLGEFQHSEDARRIFESGVCEPCHQISCCGENRHALVSCQLADYPKQLLYFKILGKHMSARLSIHKAVPQ